MLFDNGVHVYEPADVAERNETFEVAEYAPGWLLIGDDSGGAGLFTRPGDPVVYRLDLGAISPDIVGDGEPVTDDLAAWLAAGAPLPD